MRRSTALRPGALTSRFERHATGTLRGGVDATGLLKDFMYLFEAFIEHVPMVLGVGSSVVQVGLPQLAGV